MVHFMSMVTITNTGPKAITVMLEHDRVQSRYSQGIRDKATGSVSQKRIVLSLPSSVTLARGEALGGLPDEAAAYPGVLAGKARGLQVSISPDAVLDEHSDLTPEAVAPVLKTKPSRHKGK